MASHSFDLESARYSLEILRNPVSGEISEEAYKELSTRLMKGRFTYNDIGTSAEELQRLLLDGHRKGITTILALLRSPPSVKDRISSYWKTTKIVLRQMYKPTLWHEPIPLWIKALVAFYQYKAMIIIIFSTLGMIWSKNDHKKLVSEIRERAGKAKLSLSDMGTSEEELKALETK